MSNIKYLLPIIFNNTKVCVA